MSAAQPIGRPHPRSVIPVLATGISPSPAQGLTHPPPLTSRCGTLGRVAVWRLGALREQERTVIETINFLSNVGEFKRVVDGASLPLERLTLVYAENGRGKTTLAEILRSLATGNPMGIIERKRIDSDDAPVVVITFAGDSDDAVFNDEEWNIPPLTTLTTFDDQFVAANVCSGLEVDNAHRQSLHTLILGERGVALNTAFQALVDRRPKHNAELRERSDAILSAVPLELRKWIEDKEGRIDQFCALNDEPDVANKLQDQVRLRDAAEHQEEINKALRPEALSLTPFDLEQIESVLARDLPGFVTAAVQRIGEHVAHLGRGGERWLSEGVSYLDASAQPTTCPFCLQDLTSSSLLEDYKRYFSDAYRDLKSEAQRMRDAIAATHGSDAQTRFERAVGQTDERLRFWSDHCPVESIEIDAQAIVASSEGAHAAVAAHLEAKRDAPLEPLSLSTDARDAIARYEESRSIVAAANRSVEQSRRTIATFVDQLEAADEGDVNREIMRLTAVQTRYLPEVAPLCDAYMAAQEAKSKTEDEITRVRQQLADHRQTAFPKYEERLNHYLERFGAGFSLKALTPRDIGGPSSTYALEIKGRHVQVNKQDVPDGEYSFGNTLSSGDRNTLAFSMFLVAIDLHPNPGELTVVIDDPISSLDHNRSFVTVVEIANLIDRVAQVIVLSHSKSFLCDIWERAGQSRRDSRTAIKIVRSEEGSSLRQWDVNRDLITEYDRAHDKLTNYLRAGGNDLSAIAKELRPHLEGYLRFACTGHFRPGDTLGSFIDKCRKRLEQGEPILAADQIDRLDEIRSYANRFHHDTNPRHAEETITDGELRPFVKRTLKFTRP